MDIKLYHTPETRADRVRWLLHELDIPYELVRIDLFSGQTNTAEYKKIHPHGLVPAIDIDGHIMFESCAICHWLTDMFPIKNWRHHWQAQIVSNMNNGCFMLPT